MSRPAEATANHGRIAALDGIRALAVLAVLLFHLHVPGVDGGFVGVDVFFVLSGFLITGLLLHDVRRSGTVRLARFWTSRGARFFALAFLLHRYGERARPIIEKRLGLWMGIGAAILVVGIAAALYFR